MSAERPLAYVDLSGYAFTGKHAAIDLLREFRRFHVAKFAFEFNIMRVQGGIRDLETALVDDWSPIRSNAAIQRYRLLIDRFASKNAWLRPTSWFHATGWNYEVFFQGRFRARSNRYLEELSEAEWMAEWPYPMAEMHGTELFRRKLLRLLGVKSAFDVPVVLAAPSSEAFMAVTRDYLADLLTAFAEGSGAHTVVMHNTCEPFNPGRALRYFYDARSIIVDRDPRDNYVAQFSVRSVMVPPEIFVQRYRLYRELAKKHADPPGRVLRLQFESLVLDYEQTLPRIYAFLGMAPADHIAPRRYFKPEESSRNIGIWRSHPKQDEIEYIRRELSDFCYHS
jgi:hypothetical protein